MVRAHSDAKIAEHLGTDGIPLDAYSLVGEPGSELIGLYLPDIGFRFLLIRTNDLARECKVFLGRRGARRFRDSTEWQAVAHAERWPGWERHSLVVLNAEPAPFE